MAYFNLNHPYQLFFPSWTLTTTKGQILLLIGVAALSLLLEFLNKASEMARRQVLKGIVASQHSNEKEDIHPDSPTEEGAAQRLTRSRKTNIRMHLTIRQSLQLNLVATSIYVAKILLAYLLMLAVMTYNYLVFLVIVLAAVAGYFLQPLKESFICCSRPKMSTGDAHREGQNPTTHYKSLLESSTV